jgi:pimeloyl-ACP methyl ester carboxylesterase
MKRESERVERWRSAGRTVEVSGHAIHTFRREGSDPPLVLLHGFPSSSFDWRRLLEEERGQAVLAFDFLGFGLSDKPRDGDFGLFAQTDLTLELVRRELGGRPVFLVAHDMGTSVATELMARDLGGELDVEVAGALLFNGSILLERAHPTTGQKLLRTRAAPLFARLMNEPFFRRQFGSLFSPGHPLDPDEAADQWSLIRHGGGHRLAHRLIVYMDERERHAERWHGAFRDWPRPLQLLWGMYDPVAVPAVLDGLRELRPHAPVTELPDVGHYPQIEVPDRVAGAVRAAVRAAG